MKSRLGLLSAILAISVLVLTRTSRSESPEPGADDAGASQFLKDFLAATRSSEYYLPADLRSLSIQTMDALSTRWSARLAGTATDEFLSQLAEQAALAACSPRPRAEACALATLLTVLPSPTANPKDIDCLLSDGEEDEVIWLALDVWRKRGRPQSSAVRQLSLHAKDARTIHRLMEREAFINFTLSARSDEIPVEVAAPTAEALR